MKKLFLFKVCILISINSYSQSFKKDTRPSGVKEDYMDEYQASQISKLDLLEALNSLGVRVFNCKLLPQFSKSYNLTIDLEEFENGKLISTKNISPDETNVYYYYEKNKKYADYISNIKLIARDADSVCLLSVDIMGNTTGGIKLKKHHDRQSQFYSWRRFSKSNWKLNTKVPMLCYSSSWYDKKFDLERSCGAVDLSNDLKATKELMSNSPHYFLISYSISN